MKKTFNSDGYCDPGLHYMVDLSSRLKEIKSMVDSEKYFTINRARQYGKTTILSALADYLKDYYEVVSLDFQTMSSLAFENEQSFVAAFSEELLDLAEELPDNVEGKISAFADRSAQINSLQALFKVMKTWCKESEKKIVLIIDEVDTAANNQVFIDFLAQFRACYLKRRRIRTFQSVILAGVYDIRSIKGKIHPDEIQKENSPWNIAADFLVDLSFCNKDIVGMLEGYETDFHTGMNIDEIAGLLYDYTSGYPYLVSRLCKLMDERIAGTPGFEDKSSVWTKAGCLTAVKMLLEENNPLFDSLVNKLYQFPELNAVISRHLFQGQPIAYDADDPVVRNARMFGFVEVHNSMVQIANRIFEMVFYNLFLTSASDQNTDLYKAAVREKNQFICNGHLNMELVLEKFVIHFDDLYGDCTDRFKEEDGRRYFLLYLRPIINGIGNYYIESRTRNMERTDVVIDYNGEQIVVELKIWRGNAYKERGEEQLEGYLEHYHLKKGYMLSYNFNKNKKIGVSRIVLGDKVLIEAVV